MRALKRFFVEDPLKEHIMQEFATGFVSHFEYPPPRPWGYVDNYPVLQTPEGKEKFTAAMKKQVEAGKMIGGPG